MSAREFAMELLRTFGHGAVSDSPGEYGARYIDALAPRLDAAIESKVREILAPPPRAEPVAPPSTGPLPDTQTALLELAEVDALIAVSTAKWATIMPNQPYTYPAILRAAHEDEYRPLYRRRDEAVKVIARIAAAVRASVDRQCASHLDDTERCARSLGHTGKHAGTEGSVWGR